MSSASLDGGWEEFRGDCASRASSSAIRWARVTLDRHATYVVAAYIAGTAR